LHPGAAAIDTGSHVGVVGAAAVLSFGANVVVAKSATAVVIDLEVTGCFCKAITVGDIVNDVIPVKQVGYGRWTIGSRFLGKIER
jgi:hypothetical protein